MVRHVVARTSAILQGLMLLAVASCESTDRRLAEFAQRANEQQSKQNERLAEQSKAVVQQSQEVAAAAHELVEQDAAARRELLAAQQQWQEQTHVERSDLDRERREIDRERKAAAQGGIRDPVIGQAIVTVGLALAALVPLALTAYALRRLPQQAASDHLLDELLLAEWNAPNRESGELGSVTGDGRSSRLARSDGAISDPNSAH